LNTANGAIAVEDSAQLGQVLVRLRQTSGLSQTALADRIQASGSASRISRLESGDLKLTAEEAQAIARAIGTPEAIEYADYLSQRWAILDRPGFEHPNHKALWKAEAALQRLKALEDDPDLKNVLLKQVHFCRDALVRTAKFLRNCEHPIALIGSPGVGKTTLICSLANLRDDLASEQDLEHQMVLQTGGGRTTICEVHVRYGNEYAVTVEPCTDEEMRQFVAEFCDYIVKLTSDSDANEAVGLSAEIDRALRNMTNLAIKKSKGPDGKLRRDDPAKELASKFPNRGDLQTQVFARLELPRRQRISMTCPREASGSGLRWLSRVFADINYGRHPEFALPRRIEVILPERILDEDQLAIRLIDTRGVDEPTAPRRDLQAYLDDENAIIVFCSSFKDSPDAAMLDVLSRAVHSGLRDAVARRSAFVVLPQGGEETKVRDSVGDLADTVEDGRLIKEEQIRGTFARLGLPELPVEFTDVMVPADCEKLRAALLELVFRLRHQAEAQIASLIATTDHLIANRENEEVRAAFEEVARKVEVWASQNESIPNGEPHVEKALLADMAGLRYASSLRASVNRRGDWYNFDYWHGLGFGSRCEAVSRTEKQVAELKAVLKNLSDDSSLSDAHGFLQQIMTEVEAAVKSFYEDVQAVGEAAFGEQLRDDDQYWHRCRNRWGAGQGYKMEIRQWTDDWFSEERRAERRRFIESELQRRWAEVVSGILSKVAAAAPVTKQAGTTST
jgi:transcriptional regulator with XRE-family HTH domain/GTPase SAR1 family protein